MRFHFYCTEPTPSLSVHIPTPPGHQQRQSKSKRHPFPAFPAPCGTDNPAGTLWLTRRNSLGTHKVSLSSALQPSQQMTLLSCSNTIDSYCVNNATSVFLRLWANHTWQNLWQNLSGEIRRLFLRQNTAFALKMCRLQRGRSGVSVSICCSDAT